VRNRTLRVPSYIRVRDVRNKLLHLRRHLQGWACILKPPHPGLLGSSPTRRNSLPLGLGTGAEKSQACGVPPFKESPSRKVLNSLLLVSSDALTPLAHYVCKLHSRNLEIAQTHCAIPRLRKRIAQSQDWLRNLEIGTQFHWLTWCCNCTKSCNLRTMATQWLGLGLG